MIYLDHAATTPMHPDAIAAMAEHLARVGNANSLHASGRAARRVVEESRETLAAAVGARPSHIVFTSGGTEADNLAVKGLYWSRRADDARRTRVLAAKIEHHAVLDPLVWLEEHEGATIDWLPVDRAGRVLPEVLDEALRADPDSAALVTVMWANNEVGTVQPIQDLVAVAHAYDVPIHSDAVQAVGHLPVDFTASGLDAMTVTGHKIGGPIGVGALLLDRKVHPTPLLHGGGQERDVRSGTLDAPAIAGFAVAATAAAQDRDEESVRIASLRDALIDGVLKTVPDAILSGDPNCDRDPRHRLPSIAHFCFPGCEGDSLLLLLDARGIEVSTGSACSAGIAQPSHVLLAMGADPDLARGSLRFSLGRTSTPEDVESLVSALPSVVDRARSAGLS
ncbi:MAG TPA: cysteine desulfurase family protein [Actinocrinis sp.]|jgi:cysteine desulfurase|uniref:cysteine desulfurase family protein n=1 Tax=Actinocrinis sp. TaxID=1920516 RepID=UPI002DDD1356|nr:cysteine desulfurase family protein [Actinocrinis sp.]HEV3171652.1 cysteine desulfurase family protein [Actinocrinis sp.]